MKLICIAAIGLMLLCTACFAGEDIKELPASAGKISFPHRHHQELINDCLKCHEKGPGKIAELNREWAHRTCTGCHQKMEKGPVSCKGCHAP